MTWVSYDAFDDPYCYKGTVCLKNRLGLKDVVALEAAELEMSTLRAAERLPPGKYGPPHYRRVHRHLFRDVYSWSGKYRTVRTAKGGNWFCFPEHIDAQMDQLFAGLGSPKLLPGADAENFVLAAAEFLAELNAIHPFREGNGRTQLAFVYLLALRAKHPIDLQRIRPETFMPAMIESFHGRVQPLQAELQALLI